MSIGTSAPIGGNTPTSKAQYDDESYVGYLNRCADEAERTEDAVYELLATLRGEDSDTAKPCTAGASFLSDALSITPDRVTNSSIRTRDHVISLRDLLRV